MAHRFPDLRVIFGVFLLFAFVSPVPAQIPGIDLGPAKEEAAPPEPEQETPEDALTLDGGLKFRVDNPRTTMRTYLAAMNEYKQGLKTGNPRQLSAIKNAVDTLNLTEINPINRQEIGVEAAIFLKEYLDRIIVIDYNKIPTDPEEPYWTLAGTNVVIQRVQQGDNKGEWLFAPSVVRDAESWYEAVKERPYLPETGGGAGYRQPWVEKNLPRWAFNDLFGIKLWQWIGLLLFIFLGFTSRAVVKAVANAIIPLTKKTPTDFDTLLVERCSGPLGLVVNGIVWVLALHLLRFRGDVLTVLKFAVQIIVSIALIWLVFRLVEVVDHFIKRWMEKRRSQDGMDKQLAKLAVQSLKVFVLVFGVLLAIQNLGVNVFSLLAGLGIFGAAMAFAAQDTLKNFFGSVLIMIDRPFRVGDWVVIAGDEGTVEDIGFRSTRIRTFYNSLITVPNGEVAIKSVDNMGMRTYRRYKTTLGVTYDTPPEKIDAFCEGIKNIIKANPYTRKDYFHVVANDFGSSSINVMLYMFYRVPDWSQELVQRHNTICEIINLAKRLEIEFAFPTETLHVESLVNPGVMKQHPAYTREDIATGAKEFGPRGKLAQPSGSGLFVPPVDDPDLTGKSNVGGDGE